MTAFPPLSLRGHTLLPIVQGGMGVGVSAHGLAGSVARAGAMGTIASIDLRHHHADRMEQAKHCRDKDKHNHKNQNTHDHKNRTTQTNTAKKKQKTVNVM